MTESQGGNQLSEVHLECNHQNSLCMWKTVHCSYYTHCMVFIFLGNTSFIFIRSYFKQDTHKSQKMREVKDEHISRDVL